MFERHQIMFSVFFAVAMLTLWGCAEEGTDQATEDGIPTIEAEVTYAQDIAPLMETHCVGCHSDGGSAPFVLDSFEALEPLADSALAAMESGQMPPWQPNPDCRTFQDERLMVSDEIALFRDWVAEGKAPGELSAVRTAESSQTVAFEATHTATVASPYVPSLENPDDYRCFVLDLDFEKEMYMTASTVLPDAGALVHHVLVYTIAPDQLDSVLEANANEANEGYTCFGAPFPSSAGSGLSSVISGLPTQIGAWVPGSAPQVLDPGTAIRIEAGSKIVMQVHYNTLAATPIADQTAFVMRLTEDTPDFLINTRPLVIRSLDIPSGEPEAINQRTYTNHGNKALTLDTVSAHMHLLGTRYKAQIERSGGQSECLLEIPEWDFNWQQSYRLPEPVVLQPGDAITLECVYDNSATNQPIVNGEQIEPRDVTWGEGTLDEMCMLYLSTIKPFEAIEGSGQCGNAATCTQTCEAEGGTATTCLLQCAESLSCQVCGLRSLSSCAGSCLGQLAALQSDGCLENCFVGSLGLGSNVGSCFSSTCTQSYDALTACLDPIITAGVCDEGLQGCGLRD